MTAMSAADLVGRDGGAVAERIADRLRRHPAVQRLDAGRWGAVCSYLPGRRVAGVRIDPERGVVQIAVVVRLGSLRPGAVALPELADELRDLVRTVTGEVPIDIVITDVTVTDVTVTDVTVEVSAVDAGAAAG